MLLDLILIKMTDAYCKRIIGLTKSSMGLLLSLVKDLLDLKMIKENKFTQTMQAFNPMKALEFVKSIL